MAKKSKKELTETANAVIKLAEEYGLEDNEFFTTTLKRYQVQIRTLDELEQAISEAGALVTKEYVKGRENIYTHPAINAYNNTTNSANRTVETLIKIVKSLREDKVKKKVDPLMEILNGGDED